jgi:hypothetical protein
MATYAYTFTSGDTMTPTKLNNARTVSAIQTADISDVQITEAKLAADSVSTTKITDGNVTLAKLVTAVQQALLPVGAVQAFARSTAPAGWLSANGNTIGSASSGATNASADYSALFAALWDNWSNTDLPILDSAGAASTRGASATADFSANKRLPLPDLRGIFVRGSGSQTISGITYNKTFAAKEGDALQGHYHDLYVSGGIRGTATANNNVDLISSTPNLTLTDRVGALTTNGTNGTPRIASETRPANIAMLYCIKF